MSKINFLNFSFTIIVTSCFFFAQAENPTTETSCEIMKLTNFSTIRNKAAEQISNLKSELLTYGNTNTSDSEAGDEQKIKLKLDEVMKTINCINDNIPSTTIECSYPSEFSIYITPINSLMFLKPFFNEVNIRPISNNLSFFYQASLLIHELSHICGTEDLICATEDSKSYVPTSSYNPTNVKPSEQVLKNYSHLIKILGNKMTVENWSDSADHYRLWSLYGFCIPGEDCHKKLHNKAINAVIENRDYWLKLYRVEQPWTDSN